MGDGISRVPREGWVRGTLSRSSKKATRKALRAAFERVRALRRGRQAQHDHLSGFFATLESFNGATLHSAGVGDDVTLNEWTFDMTGPDGPILWNEILVRRWADGEVVSERYYTA